jgi:hypothetical protein
MAGLKQTLYALLAAGTASLVLGPAAAAAVGAAPAGSCSTGQAPLIRLGTLVHATGSACPAGRVYFHVKIPRAGFPLVLEWQAATGDDRGKADFNCQTGNICDYALYKPGTSIYTIDSQTPRCGNLNSHYTPWAVDCRIPRAGTWLVAIGANGTLRVRAKHG